MFNVLTSTLVQRKMCEIPQGKPRCFCEAGERVAVSHQLHNRLQRRYEVANIPEGNSFDLQGDDENCETRDGFTVLVSTSAELRCHTSPGPNLAPCLDHQGRTTTLLNQEPADSPPI